VVAGDLVLVAFDVSPWADVVQPRLTTMTQPTELIERETVRLILAGLAAPICLHAVS
jgi:LacI family transcriptional regulator